MTSDLDRLREGFAAAADAAPPARDCPDPDRLWSAARGELPAGELPPLVQHTARCPACAEAWRLARDLPPEAAVVDIAAARPRRRAVWMAAAAALAIAAAVLLYLRFRGDGGSAKPLFRGDQPEVELLIADGAELGRDALVLTWRSAGAGARYDVHVFTHELAEIDRARGIDATSWRVAPERVAALPAGALLYWRIEARLADGGTMASPTWKIRLP